MTLLRAAVVGATGRMGKAVVRLAAEHGVEIVRAVARGAEGDDIGVLAGRGPSGVRVERGVGSLSSGGFDVVVDFSLPEVTAELAGVAAGVGAALVSGTTGLDEAARRALELASMKVPTLWEPNFSLGVHVLVSLVRSAARQLGGDFDAEVIEAHHRLKVDAPSGTAARIVEALKEGAAESARVVHGRTGRPGPRPAGEIGVHSVRGGDVVGEHTVHFFGPGERIELTHRASDRDVFARGALRAASFIAGKPPGRYGISDLLAERAPRA